MIEGSIIGVIMTSVNSVGLMNTNLPVPVSKPDKKNNKAVAFKAQDSRDKFVRQPQMMSPQDAALYKAVQEQQKEAKRQKLKSNIAMGVSVAACLAIILTSLIQMKTLRGDATVNEKVGKLTQRIKKVINPNIKREAEEELARQPYERNLYRVEDLLKIDELATKIEKKVPADIKATKKHMDENVIGMDEAKEKIIDYLKAINYDIEHGITQDKPIVLCLDGSPGTGKSTLVKEIADALGMYFKKVSLGGAKNGEMITGFERTYAGATPGVIAKAQLEGGTKKVLYGFDEAEKAAGSSVLDVLLPIFDNQRIFTDKYYNANIDLSQSIFMLTTNNYKLLPEALRNRVQVIRIKDYTPDIKAKIAKSKLTKELAENKMTDKVRISDDAYMAIANLTDDKGGRQTTQFVDNLIQKIKGLFVEGEKDIIINKDLIERLKINTMVE